MHTPKSQFSLGALAAILAFLTFTPHSSHAQVTHLAAEAGTSGGEIGNAGAGIVAHTATGHGIGGGVSNLVSGIQEKSGYIGQLYDPVSVEVNAASPSVNEGATVQLSAIATMDDLTTLVLDPADLAWSVTLGPLTGIDAAGLATADLVYEDTLATAQGDYLTFSDTTDLTVLNTDSDNFGAYAGDGLGDDWQVTFFGLPPNADAAPAANPDSDPHDNRTEFLTGYDPTDSSSFFTLQVLGLTGTTATLELSKIIPGTRYRVERTNDLDVLDPWTEFTNFTTPAEVFNHQLTDPASTLPREFYRIGVEPE